MRVRTFYDGDQQEGGYMGLVSEGVLEKITDSGLCIVRLDSGRLIARNYRGLVGLDEEARSLLASAQQAASP